MVKQSILDRFLSGWLEYPADGPQDLVLSAALVLGWVTYCGMRYTFEGEQAGTPLIYRRLGKSLLEV